MLDDDPLTRGDLRRCAAVMMAGIAAELVFEPSLRGAPHPWSGHQDGVLGTVTSSGLPTDVAILNSYVRHAQPPIEERWIDREVMKGYRSAANVLARKRASIGTIADALGAAYTDGEAKLSEESIRELLAT